jgi:quinol monooxygenase YgiN
MIHVLASIRVKPGQLDHFLSIFKANVPNVLAEEGCLAYAPAIDVDTGLAAQDLAPQVVTIIEQWDSVAALKAHLATPHMRQYQNAVKELVEEVSLKVLEAV